MQDGLWDDVELQKLLQGLLPKWREKEQFELMWQPGERLVRGREDGHSRRTLHRAVLSATQVKFIRQPDPLESGRLLAKSAP